MQQCAVSKLGNEYIKAVYRHPAYLTYMWSISVMPNFLRFHGQQPTRLLCPWDFPGKDIGVVCYFPLQYVEYIMRNFRLDDSQAGIRIVKRNINNLRIADDTTLMAENKEKLKSLLMRVKEESKKSGLKHSKTKTMVSSPSLHGK